jgi:hypothetical protein
MYSYKIKENQRLLFKLHKYEFFLREEEDDDHSDYKKFSFSLMNLD